jgi:hypothetical protein
MPDKLIGYFKEIHFHYRGSKIDEQKNLSFEGFFHSPLAFVILAAIIQPIQVRGVML